MKKYSLIISVLTLGSLFACSHRKSGDTSTLAEGPAAILPSASRDLATASAHEMQVFHAFQSFSTRHLGEGYTEEQFKEALSSNVKVCDVFSFCDDKPVSISRSRALITEVNRMSGASGHGSAERETLSYEKKLRNQFSVRDLVEHISSGT